MNCCKCGKRLLAGAALCLTCEKDYESVPDANTRIGYYARHPEALAKLLDENPSDEFANAVCCHDCVDNPDEEDVNCTEQNFTACITRWLLEPIEMASNSRNEEDDVL